MAKLDANNYRVFIEGTTPGTLVEIKGQRTSTCGSSMDTYSTATKDSGGWDISGAGLLKADLSVELVPDLPDATGYTRIETLHAAKSTARVQWRKAPFAVGDIVFDATVLITAIDKAYPFNDVVGSQVKFMLTGAPTVNTLA